MHRVWARWLPLVPIWILFLWCGFRGLDFGSHFDEHVFVVPLKRMARGVLLPGMYNYPSLAYYLSYIAAIPEVVQATFAEDGFFAKLSELDHLVDTKPFRLRIRGLYLIITSFAPVVVYATVLAAKRRVTSAVFAALLVTTSFEVSYHSRWFAPDGPLLVFSALTIWALVRAEEAQDAASARRALLWAAVGAALSTGTKYTAGLYLFVVLALAVRHRARFNVGMPLLKALGVPLAVYGVVYLLTTPATVLDMGDWLQQIEDQRRTYAGGHRNYTVDRGADHLSRMILYLGGELLSPYLALSVVLSGLGIFGAVHLARTRLSLALTVFAVPAMFVAVFTMQKTMIVRNLLVIVPSIVVAVAWGFDALLSTRHRWMRALVVAGGAIIVAINLCFCVWAAETVHHRRDERRFERAAARYIKQLPVERVFISAKVRRRLEKVTERPLPAGARAGGGGVARFPDG